MRFKYYEDILINKAMITRFSDSLLAIVELWDGFTNP